MGLTMFYLAVGFMALMVAPQDKIKTSDETQNSAVGKVSQGNVTEQQESSKATTKNAKTSQNGSTASNETQSTKTTTKHTIHRDNSWLDNNVTQMGGGVILLCLVISNMVLTCCICSLRRRVSSWANPRNGNPTDANKVRYVAGDFKMPADRPVEIYTMPDESARQGNGEEAHKTEGTGATAADPANGDPRSPEQAEALLPEPPAEVAEPPADDVTDALLVV